VFYEDCSSGLVEEMVGGNLLGAWNVEIFYRKSVDMMGLDIY
jgi:hypothetical protein